MGNVVKIESRHIEPFDTEDEAYAFIKGLTDHGNTKASQYSNDDTVEAFVYGMKLKAKHSNIRNVSYFRQGCWHVVRFYGDHENTGAKAC